MMIIVLSCISLVALLTSVICYMSVIIYYLTFQQQKNILLLLQSWTQSFWMLVYDLVLGYHLEFVVTFSPTIYTLQYSSVLIMFAKVLIRSLFAVARW